MNRVNVWITFVTLFFLQVLMAGEYKIKRNDVLFASSEVRMPTLEIAVAENLQPIVLFCRSYVFESANGALHLFYFREGNWRSTEKTFPMLKLNANLTRQKERLILAMLERKDNGGSECSLFRLLGNQDDLVTPYKQLLISSLDRDIPKEVSFNRTSLLPNDHEDVLMYGSYTEYKNDPISLLGRLISGGHGGYSERPFLLRLKQNNQLSFFQWPASLSQNELLRITHMLLFDKTCHITALSSKDYLPYSDRIQYATFDLDSCTWSKPEELYRSSRKGHESMITGIPNILVLDNHTWITWSLREDVKLGTGVFARAQKNGRWGDTEMISECGSRPLLAYVNEETNIFWLAEDKGIFFSSNRNDKWTKPRLLIADKNISARENTPWDLDFDMHGNIHVVYFQTENQENKHPNRLMYALCVPTAKSTD